MAAIRTSYDTNNTVSTVLPFNRPDIGPAPDFFGDLDKLTRVMKKPTGQYGQYSAGEQARALRQPQQEIVTHPAEPPRQQQPYNNYSGMTITGRSFGRPQMSQHGVWGTYVNPADVPVEFQGHIPTGFFADDVTSNYTYSPLVDPARYFQPAGGKSR